MLNTTESAPQFGTAEYAGGAGAERCKSCGQSLGSQYYRVNGATTCNYCGEQALLRKPQDSHQVFVRGLLFGLGGALLGLIIYAGFGIVTGLMIGYISLAVGWIVGKAIMKGTNGIGGRRYQIAAIALTYAAVSLSAIPIGISQVIKHQQERHRSLGTHSAAPAPATGGSADSSATADSSDDAQDDAPGAAQAPAKPPMSAGAIIGSLLFAGLASPFLELQDPIHGAIGLIILFVGLRIAWQLTAEKQLDILGPFSKSSPVNTDGKS
jgi:predicted lipid-binding transport protein (Tim44 family)